MFTVITCRSEIKKLQERFITVLTVGAERVQCKLKFPNFHKNEKGNWKTWDGEAYKPEPAYIDETTIWWSNETKMWVSLRQVRSSATGKWRYWNSFGLEKPSLHGAVSITAEINFPEAGENGHIAGIFVKNEQGKIAVVHRGKFTHGQQKITLTDYIVQTGFESVEIRNHANKNKVVLLVGELESPDFSAQVRKFLEGVSRIKEVQSSCYKQNP